jgi:NAD(P)-dependent dehydrogenase (short-subunit alcohol dehydrogenase family)
MARRYEGRTALVTGASGGLGRAVALRLAGEGARLLLVARREDALAALAETLRASGAQAEIFACDLAQPEAIADLVARIKACASRVDLLVNNAGKEQMTPLQATSPKALQELIQVNLVSALLMSRHVLGLLKEGSSIVNMSSTAALSGAAGMSVYAAAKGGLASFTRSLALELAPRQVRVNAVAPGLVRTGMLDRIFARMNEEQRAKVESRYPLGLGEPSDVAAAVAFLGSMDARWITGQILVVDGGLTA